MSNRTVVIGLGNPLMGDDGVGLVALERLRAEWEVPPEVELVDGGTWGMNLLPVIEDADQLILVDAVDTKARPGTLLVVERERLPRYLATKISPHQVDLRDVLALAELRGTLPQDTVAVGLQPRSLELMVHGLSAVVAARVGELVAAVVAQLEERGHVMRPRVPVYA